MEALKGWWMEQVDDRVNMDCWQSMQSLDEKLYNSWLEKLYSKNIFPGRAAEIVERAWKIYLLNK